MRTASDGGQKVADHRSGKVAWRRIGRDLGPESGAARGGRGRFCRSAFLVNAFQQVSNSLVAYQKGREFREQQGLLTAAAEDTDRLSKVLYQHGGASYLQVLTSENAAFAAELKTGEVHALSIRTEKPTAGA